MKKLLSFSILVLAGLFFCVPVHSATYDLTGTWNYTLSGNWAEGDIGCSPGSPASGTCTIVQTGDVFTFAYTSGVVCDPAESCTFSGTVIGNTYTCSTTDIVDDEGGSVTSTILFTAASATTAVGSGNSLYTHPSGEWACTWGNTISLAKDDGTPPIAYSLTINQTGNGTVTLDPSGGVYIAGTTVTLTAVPDEGWQFGSWSGDADGSQNPVEIIMDENKTVSAIFTRLGGAPAGTMHLLLGE
jgi:hypothetical protein